MELHADNRYGAARIRTVRAFFAMRAVHAAATALAVIVLACGTALAAPILKQGDEGHDVGVLQKNLKEAGYEVELTGVFDEATYRAVMAFQRDEKLDVTGMVDRETWKTLGQRAEKGGKVPSRDTQTHGAKPPDADAPAGHAVPPDKNATAGRAMPQEGNAPADVERGEGKEPQAQDSKKKPKEEKKEPKKEKKETKETKETKEESLPPSASVPESAPFLPKAKAEAIIRTAEKYKGTRYQFGGTTPKGFDCSGFLQYVFRQNGFSIARTADEQYKLGKRVRKRAELVPGDLVFFSTYEPGASHCGIYLGKDQFIHVSSSRGVRIDSLDNEYWKPRWYGGKHIVKA